MINDTDLVSILIIIISFHVYGMWNISTTLNKYVNHFIFLLVNYELFVGRLFS